MPDILLVVVFILWDPTIIGSRADTKKQLVVVRRGRFRFTESRRGASSADRSSMLQMNETDLRKNATPPPIILQHYRTMEGSRHETNIWFETYKDLT